jgi:hypothetical protein
MKKPTAALRRKKLAIVLKKIGWTFSDFLRSARSTAEADANYDKRLESPLGRMVFHISEAVKVVIKVPRPPAGRIKDGPGITVIPTDGEEHQFAYDFARIEIHFRRAETLWAQFSQNWPQSPAVEFGRYIHNSAVAAALRFCEQNWSARVRARLANPPAGPVGSIVWDELVNQDWTELSEAEVGQWRARYYNHWDVSNPFGKSAISQDKILRAWRILETHMRYELGLATMLITTKKTQPVRLRIDNGPQPTAVLDNVSHPIPANVAELLHALIEADGQPASMKKHGVRSRDIDGLPLELRGLIERDTGKGTWIAREKLWLN